MYYNSDIAKFGSFAINIAYWKNVSFKLVMTYHRHSIVHLSCVVIKDKSGYTLLSDVMKFGFISLTYNLNFIISYILMITDNFIVY
ncbi:hypothetical protein V1477_021098 [Vespula maculifrons]|uniref:Uncharacterized protein n=1 Tax=Vespula maculifrons TaxID=7453 RepID=A0ABD2AH45_VESMC